MSSVSSGQHESFVADGVSDPARHREVHEYEIKTHDSPKMWTEV